MASDPKYGQEPPKNDDGSYKDVLGQFGFLYFHSDGQTLENLKDGSTYDLSNIGGGSSTDTRTDVSNAGTTVVGDVKDIDFNNLISVTDDGDGTVTVDGTDTHTDVSSTGTTVVSDTGDINFGSEFSVADDADGTVTVTTTDDVIRTRQAEIVPTTISDGNSAPGVWKRVPSGKTLKILEAGVQDSTQSAPTGLTIEVYDNTNATTIMSKNALHTEGSPIGSKSGAIDVEFRVANATGGSVDASGYVLYTME